MPVAGTQIQQTGEHQLMVFHQWVGPHQRPLHEDSLPLRHFGEQGSELVGDRPGAVIGSKQESPEEGMACEEPECQAPVDPRLGEPFVRDHWSQCHQRFAWGHQGGALDTCGEAPQQ